MNLKNILKIIKQKKRFLISTHVAPDPDALCSEIVVTSLLRWLKKDVHIINQDRTPNRYLFLPGAKQIEPFSSKKLKAFDVAIIVDCGDLNRIGEVKKLLGEKTIIINIDHHITNDAFGALNLIKVEASSTSEILFEFIKQAKLPLNREIALNLYVGIMTDTGSFRYENTTYKTHEIIAQLMKYDIPVTPLYKRLYERIPFKDFELFMKVVGRYEALMGGKIILIELSKQVTSKISEEFDLRDAIFRLVRSINAVEAVIILTEVGKKKTRVNFRSSGKVDVSKLASHFKGGGHKRASGCLIEADMKKARGQILNELKKVLC